MKFIIGMLMLALALGGCTTVNVGDIDAAIQKSAPQVCDAASVAHTAYVATGLGSEKDKATVENAWNVIAPLCASPSTITATQLVVATAQVAVIVAALRRAKTNG